MNFFKTELASANLQRRFIRPDRRWATAVDGNLQFDPPQVVEWNRYTLAFSNWPVAFEGFRIVHVSDFHFRRRWPNVLDAVLEHMRSDPPDLVLITGDFVDNKGNYRPAMPQVRRLVQGLSAKIGIFAIHGNHDNHGVGRELRAENITFIDGRRIIVETPRGLFELIGLPGKRRSELKDDRIAAFPARGANVPRIVLSHFPDHLKRTNGLNADLFLAGHTHGGQICLPGGRPMMWHDSLPRKLCRGMHRVEDIWLIVSRGIGYTGLPFRAFASPEVIEVVCEVKSGGESRQGARQSK